MKMPFRFFRGEFLKGIYLRSLLLSPNKAAQDVLDELVYHTLVQYKYGDEAAIDEMPMRDDDIVDIGKIAGLYQPRIKTLTTSGSIYFSDSYIVDGAERSERGLFNIDTEKMNYFHVDEEEYSEDIASEASGNLRMTFVPEGTMPVGYVPEGFDLYTNEGEVIAGNLLSEPPTDGSPYTTYYGEKFLVFNEYFDKEVLLPIPVFKLLFECMQSIRHNGPTVTAFLNITKILCDNYVHKIEVVPFGNHYLVQYERNDESELDDKKSRYAAWQNIVEQKFKLYVLEDREA